MKWSGYEGTIRTALRSMTNPPTGVAPVFTEGRSNFLSKKLISFFRSELRKLAEIIIDIGILVSKSSDTDWTVSYRSDARDANIFRAGLLNSTSVSNVIVSRGTLSARSVVAQ